MGDSNSKVFHHMAYDRKKVITVVKLRRADGSYCTDKERQQSIVEEYFSNLFSSRFGEMHRIVNCVTCRVLEDQNRMLVRHISDEEIKNEVFSMLPDIAAGMDGFSLGFYQ